MQQASKFTVRSRQPKNECFDDTFGVGTSLTLAVLLAIEIRRPARQGERASGTLVQKTVRL